MDGARHRPVLKAVAKPAVGSSAYEGRTGAGAVAARNAATFGCGEPPMTLLEALTRGLARPGVTEFAVMAGRPPSIKVGAAYEPVSDFIPTESDVLEMLVTLGGLAYIDSLGAEPAKWRTVEAGVGTLLVKAARRQGVVQALFTLQPSSGSLPAAPKASPAPAPAGGKVPPPLPGKPVPPALPSKPGPTAVRGVNGALELELDPGPELEFDTIGSVPLAGTGAQPS